jgi:ABC-2 type transport system ATP-binding protein
MIECRNINKVFKSDILEGPHQALEDVSFSIGEGETIGFLGANGAGKTTTIKIILGFIKQTSGEIRFDSKSMGSGRMEQMSRIGYLPERPYFYPHLKGMEFLTLMGNLSQVQSHLLKERIQKWSKRLHIDHALGKPINSYSKGMLQRIGFVSALLHDPKILIMDEPLSGLDPVGRKEFKEVMQEVHAEGKTIFFSSHIVGDVEEVCRNVVVLEKGKLVYQGLISDLIASQSNSKYRVVVRGEHQQVFDKNVSLLGDMTTSISIEKSEKEIFLKQLLDQKFEILSMTPDNLSLEEVVYKIRNHE